MSSWIELRVRNYRFHPEPRDLLRWEAEERRIRRLASVAIFAAATPLLAWAKPHIDNTLWPRAWTILAFGAVCAADVLLWRNPFREIPSGGNLGDCMVRGN